MWELRNSQKLCQMDIQGVFKMHWDWHCIYQNRNKQWMKCWFSFIWSLWYSTVLFQVFYWLKYIWDLYIDTVWSYVVVFFLMSSTPSNLILETNFQFRKNEKVALNQVWSAWRVVHLHNPVFHQNLLFWYTKNQLWFLLTSYRQSRHLWVVQLCTSLHLTKIFKI